MKYKMPIEKILSSVLFIYLVDQRTLNWLTNTSNCIVTGGLNACMLTLPQEHYENEISSRSTTRKKKNN